ncbi:phosphodiester glycosidase family protein [Psychrobacter sp. HD31]|uniref:phosphodiester glycosidase family protein n=1 Tax=Psychrobacter sp. HD31 TaxID=3112003 RepID=UPI003DA2BFC9
MKYPQKHLKNLLLASISTSMATLLTACGNYEATNNDLLAACQIVNEPFAYSICQADSAKLLDENSKLDLQLFWRAGGDNTNQNAQPLFTFEAAQNSLAKNATLQFATNAGMYNDAFAPIGYTVINGQQVLSLNLNEGGGNFHLLPNGVFWWDETGYYVTESQTMATKLKNGTKPLYATQSGPMLVINGKIHPKFKPDSTSKKIRNGVGICEHEGKQTIKFVTSASVVNFYEFAHLFKNELNCKNALFFDGGIASALYAPTINRHDKKNMGVMVGLVETQ